jgi:peptidoglycan/xylan/chitin deacetylase (PgdA/CDA1 family)
MSLFGRPLRRIANNGEKTAFLTFDDGPNADFTPTVLDLLRDHNAKATFFIVAKRAEQNPIILKRILDEGHAVGNHSLDHSYSVFFKGYRAMSQWIEESEVALARLGIPKNVGFRPPNGIRTPELVRVLRERQLPLILWNQRCYDGIFEFNQKKSMRMMEQCQAGDIFLFHDRQKNEWKENFVKGLKYLLEGLSKEGFSLLSLENQLPS